MRNKYVDLRYTRGAITRSYIKIYGPPILTALRSLKQVAEEMREKMTISYVSSITAQYLSRKFASSVDLSDQDDAQVHHGAMALGDYDFFFEWGTDPTTEQVTELIQRIDTALTDCGCRYTITTK